MHQTLALEAQELLDGQELLKLENTLGRSLYTPKKVLPENSIAVFDLDSPHSVFDLRHLQKSLIRIIKFLLRRERHKLLEKCTDVKSKDLSSFAKKHVLLFNSRECT